MNLGEFTRGVIVCSMGLDAATRFMGRPALILWTRHGFEVKAGDHITSWMNFDESSQIWTVYGRNDANGEESTSGLTYAVPRQCNQYNASQATGAV